jgi:hypothetical protein
MRFTGTIKYGTVILKTLHVVIRVNFYIHTREHIRVCMYMYIYINLMDVKKKVCRLFYVFFYVHY